MIRFLRRWKWTTSVILLLIGVYVILLVEGVKWYVVASMATVTVGYVIGAIRSSNA